MNIKSVINSNDPIKVFFLVFALMLNASGCSTTSTLNRDQKTLAKQVLTSKYNGNWEVVSQPISRMGSDGEACHALFGNFKTNGDQMIGDMVRSGHNYRMDVNGNVNEKGVFEDGLAYAGQGFAMFKGKFEADYARGLWRDEHNCEGVWAAIKQMDDLKPDF